MGVFYPFRERLCSQFLVGSGQLRQPARINNGTLSRKLSDNNIRVYEHFHVGRQLLQKKLKQL